MPPTTLGRRHLKRPAIIAAAVLLLAGAASAGPVDKGAIDANGVKREYLLVRPSGKTAGKIPLVFVLHGHRGSARQALGLNRIGHSALALWMKIADREGILVAAPDGTIGPDGKRGWNDCRGDAQNNPKTDDLAFLDALAARLIKDERADPERVYVTGMSNGAMMTFRAALEMTPAPAAIAAICGSMAAQSVCGPARKPVSALIIAGTEDPLVPYGGGQVGFQRRKDRGAVVSIDESVAAWLKADGLTGGPKVEPIPHSDPKDATKATRSVWGKPEGPQVALIRVDGGGHVEPSPTIEAGAVYRMLVGRQNRDFETAEETWTFFKTKRAAK